MPVAFSNSLFLSLLISNRPIYFGPAFIVTPSVTGRYTSTIPLLYIAKMQLDSSHGSLVYSLVTSSLFQCLL